jgi:hypothetical protein
MSKQVSTAFQIFQNSGFHMFFTSINNKSYIEPTACCFPCLSRLFDTGSPQFLATFWKEHNLYSVCLSGSYPICQSWAQILGSNFTHESRPACGAQVPIKCPLPLLSKRPRLSESTCTTGMV